MNEKLLFVALAVVISSWSFADYYLVDPSNEMYRIHNALRGYELARDEASEAASLSPGFIDTVFYFLPDMVGWYLPNRDSNTIVMQLFKSEYPCSLIGFGADYYSPGWAEFYVWEGPDSLPATSEELRESLYSDWDYDSLANNWESWPAVLYGPDSIGTDDPPDDRVSRYAWLELDPKICVDTSCVWVGYRLIDRYNPEGEPYGGKPWTCCDDWINPMGKPPRFEPCRTWMFRVQTTSPLHLQWTDYGDFLGDWPFVYVIDIYQNAAPAVERYTPVLGSYDLSARTITANVTDFGVPAESSGVGEAWLFYYLNEDLGTLDSLAMTLDSGTVIDGYWNATIPAQSANTKVTYYFKTFDVQGLDAVSEPSWSYYLGEGHPDHILFHIRSLKDLEAHDPVSAVSSQVDMWDEGERGVADSTVFEYYITGPGEKGIIYLDWTGATMLEDTAYFRRFLDAGGSLLISSQDLPADFGLADDEGDPYGHWTADPIAHPFCYNYLQLRSGVDNCEAIDTLSSFSVHGVPGDPISGSLEEISVTPAHNWTGILDSVSASSNEIFFGPDSEIIGFRYEGTHKLVFLYWHFHEIGTGGGKRFEPDTASQNEFIRNALRWLGLTVRVDGRPVAGERTNAFLETQPNPLNPQTTIRYGLTTDSRVSLKVYNALGQEVRVFVDEFQQAGTYSVVWDTRDNGGRRVSSGTYFLRLEVGEQTSTKKLCVVR